MPQPIVHVDAFTDTPFRGNRAVVCLLAEPRAAGWMQDIAREMNLAETAFVGPRGGEFELRCSPLSSKWICAATPPSPAPTSCGKPAA
jgi:PhzF family phenazine biosynthesis protein